MNLLLLCLNSSILLCTGPQKCERSVWLPVKFARRWKGIFKIHYTTRHFISKKYLSLVFYENRNLKISKSKKSEQYFRDKIEYFIRLLDKHLARHFESYWRETWRHTDRRTVPQISLKTPSSHPLLGEFQVNVYCFDQASVYLIIF